VTRHLLPTLAVALTLGAPAAAHAHGVLGHVHVTGWAIENLPPGELADLFADPAVRDAAVFGAAFPDSGYAPDAVNQGSPAARAYAEHCHWEPFVEDYVQWMRANDPPPFTSLESRRRVAFLLGVAAHGMQDEVFDSLFLDQIAEKDGPSDPQAEADPGTDGFLAVDGLLRFSPDAYVPTDVLLPLLDGIGHEITEETMAQGVGLIGTVYLHPVRGPRFAESLADKHGPNIPWARDHYLDRGVPGSLRSEIGPTMGYMQAVWDRLHGRFDEADLVVGAYPEAPRRLRSGEPTTVDSRISMIFGLGVRARDADVALADGTTTAPPITSRGTRWGGPDGWSRVLRADPQYPLDPGATYTLVMRPGAALVTGASTTLTHEHTFQVDCDAPTLCPPLEDLDTWRITAPDPPADAGDPAPDAGLPGDAGGDPYDVGFACDMNGQSADAPTPRADTGCAAAGQSPPPRAPALVFVLGLLGLNARRARRSRPGCGAAGTERLFVR
jgi:hypothetical protein